MHKTLTKIEMKKVNLERKAKVCFAHITDDNYVNILTFKQFLNSTAVLKMPSEYLQKETLRSLLSQIQCMRTKLEYNKFAKQEGNGYFEKVIFLLNNGAKWAKSGLVI